jgi:hypothetical protein
VRPSSERRNTRTLDRASEGLGYRLSREKGRRRSSSVPIQARCRWLDRWRQPSSSASRTSPACTSLSRGEELRVVLDDLRAERLFRERAIPERVLRVEQVAARARRGRTSSSRSRTSGTRPPRRADRRSCAKRPNVFLAIAHFRNASSTSSRSPLMHDEFRATPKSGSPSSRSTGARPRRLPDCVPNQVRCPRGAKCFSIAYDLAALGPVPEGERSNWGARRLPDCAPNQVRCPRGGRVSLDVLRLRDSPRSPGRRDEQLGSWPRRVPNCAPNQVRGPRGTKFSSIPCDFAALGAVLEDERRNFE